MLKKGDLWFFVALFFIAEKYGVWWVLSAVAVECLRIYLSGFYDAWKADKDQDSNKFKDGK